ncbi:CAP domain-containing protein [Gaetbulibacter aestuarii]|uniref:CAP domain-containing protein n=1 Tax=Gaetbulibacter aestuarii TaxID=1502358 RepID=A0ABW7MZN2_9FLAO
MKLVKLSLLIAITISGFSCSTDSLEAAPNTLELKTTVVKTKPIEVETLNLINEYRTSKGLSPLNNMNIIKSVAETHTDYMVEINQVNHDNFYERSAYLKENAGATNVSENVAYGYTSAQSLVNAWVNSDSHRANIEGDFTDFDISAEQNSEGKWYYTNIFIKK